MIVKGAIQLGNYRKGINIYVPKRKVSRLSLYDDSLIVWPNSGSSYIYRQLFSSSTAGNLIYGGGSITQNIGAAGRHILVHFNCDKQNYSTYDNATSYGLNSIVYGGIYGHALFQKTAIPSTGLTPNFLFTPVSTQDANGWTRYRPTLPQINIGQQLEVSFSFIANTALANFAALNAFRFGLFDSSSAVYINRDNTSGTATEFTNYTGYMFTISSTALPSLNQRIYTRTPPNTTLINSILAYTDKLATSSNGFAADLPYNIKITIKRTGATSINIVYSITGSGITDSILAYEDLTPASYAFDTLVFFGTSNTCNSFTISNISPVIITTR